MITQSNRGPWGHKLKQVLLSLTLLGVVGTPISIAEGLLFTGAAEGGGPRVSGYSVPSFSVFLNQFVFEPEFRGGAAVAVTGDVSGDGVPDLVVGAGPGGGPRLTIFDGRALLQNQLVPFANFYVGNPNERHGISVGVTDVNADGYADVLIGFRTGGEAYTGLVQVLNGERLRYGIHSLMFDQPILGTNLVGTQVAGGDVDHDGYGDIIVGADNGGGPVVQILRGSFARSNLVSRLASFFAFSENFSGGVRVASGDVNGDGYSDVFVGPGPGGAPLLNVYSGAYFALQNGSPVALVQNACVFDCNLRNGLYVGGSVDLNRDNYSEVLVSSNGVARTLDGGRVAGGQIADAYLPFAAYAGYGGGLWMASAIVPDCSNGKDDDGDGAIDLNDFSCQGNPRKNDEGLPRAQCQDGVDNDGDGRIDMNDPGCSSPQDNDEYNVPTATPIPTSTATARPMATSTATPIPQCTAVACGGGTIVCPLANGCPGGCGRICVPNPTVTPTRTATAIPTATSIGLPRPTQTPTPRATSTRTSVPATSTPAATSTPVAISTIAPACIDHVTVSLTAQLDRVAIQLSEIANKAADDLFKIAKRQNGNIASAQRDVLRTKALSKRLYDEATSLTLRFPTVSRTCPNLPPACREVDNRPTILALTRNYLESTNAVARTLNRAGFRAAQDTRRFMKTIRDAKAIRKNGYDVLARLPQTAISCAS